MSSPDFDMHRFFSLSRDLLCVAGFDGQFKLIGAAWQPLLGYDDAQLKSRPFVDFVHPEDRARTRDEMARVLDGGVVESFQNRYVARDGTVRLLSWSATVDRDRKLVYAVARDITNATAEEQRFAAVVTAMAEGVVVHDASGAIVAWNNSAERILGLTGDQLAGRTSFDPRWRAVREDGSAFPGEEHPAMVTLRTGVAQRDVLMGVHKPDGTVSWISINTQPIGAGTGAAVASFKDITVKRQIGTELRAKSERMRAVLDTVVDGIVTIDDRGRVESLNPAAERIFGYRADEVIGNNVSMLMPEPTRSAHDGYIAHHLQTGEKRVIGVGREVAARRKDGSTFPMDLAVGEMCIDGRPLFVGVLRDITERKRLDRLQQEFISSVSHELRTPLNAIVGFTQLLGLDSSLSGTQRDQLEKIRTAGEHLHKLVNDVLDLSLIQSGNLSIHLEPVEVGPLLRDCGSLMQSAAAAQGVAIVVDATGADGVWVRADRARLRQVLLNLISNAVKYNRRGGSVWVACMREPAGPARISVRDDGPGIAVDRQAELFKPFHRLGAERSDIAGTGIGLTISRQLASLMGATLAVTSTPGQGSTFTIELEAERAAAPAQGVSNAAVRKGAVPRAAHCTVLCVEDNLTNRVLIQSILARLWPNAEVLCAETAESGLEMAERRKPDLVLMDINLPGMSGYDALARIRSIPALHAVPVVAVTAGASPEEIDRGIAAGFTDYITKPIDLSRFVAMLDHLLPAARQDAAGTARKSG
jgi:PAS domain S-box-containing protein